MKKKLFSIIALLCLTVSSAWAAFVGSGTAEDPWKCGGCDVTLVSGTLTVSKSATGNGAMEDYTSFYDRPWYNYVSSITSVVIENGVTSIGVGAFHGTALTSITIPASVTNIGKKAFYKCSSLTSIEIPASVTSIGDNVFVGCSQLTSINVNAGNANYASEDGVLFNKDMTTLIQYPIKKSATSYTIPSSVTTIGKYAFCECSTLTSVTIPTSVTAIDEAAFNEAGLTSITIPASVTSIGKYAFYECPNLAFVIFVSGSQLESIGEMVFYKCPNLEDIEIPTSVTSIGEMAFRFCTGLTKVTFADGSTLTTIGNSAFEGCDNAGLTTVTIPASVTSIGESAFAHCSSLASVNVCALPSCSLGSEAFDYCATSLQINVFSDLMETFNSTTGWSAYSGIITAMAGDYSAPESNVTWSLNSSGVMTFEGTGKMVIYNSSTNADAGRPWRFYSSCIKSVVIEDVVTSIGQVTFFDCKNLASIELPNTLEDIGIGAFANCTGLPSVTIPNSVTSIREKAFVQCHSLKTITIPASVTSIEINAFNGCTSLSSVLILAPSLTTYGSYAFYNNAEGRKIYVPKGCANAYQTGWGDYSSAIVEFDGYCGDISVNEGKNVAWALTDEDGNNTKETLTIVGSGAMADFAAPDAQPWEGSSYKITSVVIGDGVTHIGKNAFNSCSALTSVTIPASVTSIGSGAFLVCSSLETITVDQNNTKYNSGNGCNAIIETNSNTLIVGCKNTVIPASVTSIGESAFSDCIGLTSITIPASVTSIVSAAFNNCANLKSVIFADGSHLATIGAYAFNQTDLTSITIPASVTYIDIGVFSGCKNLTTISVNTENTTYDSRDNCNAIIETESKTLIAGCKSTIIPNTVTSIGGYAFDNCTNLTSVTIPTSVTSIGTGAFYYCTNLGKVYVLPTTVPTMGSEVFEDCTDENFAIIVPAAKYADYYSASGWSSYQSKMKKGYSVACPDGVTTTGVGPLVQQGETVTLSATTPVGYQFGGYSVKDADGATVNVTETAGVYTFAMPENSVTVTRKKLPNVADIVRMVNDKASQADIDAVVKIILGNK